jgi:hypothetical protein
MEWTNTAHDLTSLGISCCMGRTVSFKRTQQPCTLQGKVHAPPLQSLQSSKTSICSADWIYWEICANCWKCEYIMIKYNNILYSSKYVIIHPDIRCVQRAFPHFGPITWMQWSPHSRCLRKRRKRKTSPCFTAMNAFDGTNSCHYAATHLEPKSLSSFLLSWPHAAPKAHCLHIVCTLSANLSTINQPLVFMCLHVAVLLHVLLASCLLRVYLVLRSYTKAPQPVGNIPANCPKVALGNK